MAEIDGGHVPELIGKYKLRVTEISIAPGGHVGTGDVNHRVEDESGAVSKHLLFEILPVGVGGPSLIPPR